MPLFSFPPRLSLQRDPPPVRPHLLIWGLAIGQMVGWGSLYYSLAVVALPMEQELGWSKVDINAGLMISLMVASVAAIPVGALIDRYGGYWFMVLGAAAAALLLLIWSTTSSMTVFYLVWAGLGLAHACTLSESAYNIVVSNLADHRRGITMISLLSGLSSAFAIPFITLLSETLGWRPAIMTMAAIHFMIPGLVSAYVLRGIRSSRHKPEGVGSSLPAQRLPLRRIMRDRVFWALVAAFSINMFVGNGITFHTIPLLLEEGYAMSLIVGIMTLHGPSQVVARFALLMVGTRISTAGFGRIAFVLLVLTVVMLILGTSFGLPALVVFGLLFGVSTGMLTLVRANSVVEYLGSYGYGAATGALTMAVALPRTTAAVVFALMWEFSGGYATVLWMALLASLFGLAAFWLATLWNSQRSTPIQGL
ncbi:MAG: MFS transporter [Alphaproteobacteria bacterium]|nr:MFS transporter [Alphaproteobacteria bacterium]